MTTAKPSATTTQQPKQEVRFRLPEPPKRELDEMTSYDHLYKPGNAYLLIEHFGNPETTLVEADRWIVPSPEFNKARARRPDLLIAFDVSAADYQASNGYIVSEQGKPPDFVLEVASESTAEADVGAKRDYYAELGIPEYWRFDETGEFHGTGLAGDRLVNGQYQSMLIEELPDGVLQGYSAALNLNLRWDNGQLVWHDPATGRRIVTPGRRTAGSSERAGPCRQRRSPRQQRAAATDPGRSTPPTTGGGAGPVARPLTAMRPQCSSGNRRTNQPNRRGTC